MYNQMIVKWKGDQGNDDDDNNNDHSNDHSNDKTTTTATTTRTLILRDAGQSDPWADCRAECLTKL